jgi:hypothetical protein
LAPPACCCGCCCVGPPLPPLPPPALLPPLPLPLPLPRLPRRLGLEPALFLAPDWDADLVVAASATAGDGGRLPKVSSSKDRSSFTCRNVGKGRARRSRAPMCVKRSLRPRSTLRMRVRSVTTSPKAVRSSAIFFRRRQYSVMERSPCTKLRNFVLSWIARVS